MPAISPTQSNVQQALIAFLGAVLPGLPGQTPAVFVGSIAGNVLTVGPLPGKVPVGIQGTIQVNAPLLGLGVAPGTTISAMLTGTGGVGTYQVSIPQTVASATMSTGVSAVPGQVNRVPEPVNPFFAVATIIRSPRFSTNVDGSADVKFIGSITGTVLSVSDVIIGTIQQGATLSGTGVAFGTTIINQISGPIGGAGTYSVLPSQNNANGTMSAGIKTLSQNSEFVFQCDFHSPDSTAGDFAKTVSTAIRDEYGTTFFASLVSPLNGVVPLFADDPVQMGWTNDSAQWETRWILEIHLEAVQIISVPQQYSDSASVTVVDVTAAYPPN